MFVEITKHFIEGNRQWRRGENPDLPPEVAQRWIADGRAVADTDGVRGDDAVGGAGDLSAVQDDIAQLQEDVAAQASALTGKASTSYVDSQIAALDPVALAALQVVMAKLLPSWLYLLPAPTGNATTDSAALTAAFGSSATSILGNFAGAYVINGNHDWPAGKRLTTNLGRGLVIFRGASGSTAARLFVLQGNANGTGADRVVFDGNNANRATGTNGWISFVDGTRANSSWNECDFIESGNLYGLGVFGADHTLTRCRFAGAAACLVSLIGAVRPVLDRCTFTDWNRLNNTDSSPAIQMQPASGVPCKGVRVIEPNASNARTNSFFVESVADIVSRTLNQIKVKGGTVDGNGLRGCGISGAFSDSLFEGITFAAHGFAMAFEVTGHNNLATKNIIMVRPATSDYDIPAQPIVLYSVHNSSGMSSGCRFDGNTIDIQMTKAFAVGGSARAVVVYGQQDFSVNDNTIQYLSLIHI